MKDTNELTYKTETYRLNELMVAREDAEGEGLVREFGTDTYTLLYLKWITNNLLHSTGNSAQCYVAAWMRGEFVGESVCTRTLSRV